MRWSVVGDSVIRVPTHRARISGVMRRHAGAMCGAPAKELTTKDTKVHEGSCPHCGPKSKPSKFGIRVKVWLSELISGNVRVK